MIGSLQLIRNVGRFDSMSGGAHLPFAKLSLIYAENGHGKTTLAGIFRSLATGNATSITERRRLASQHPPHVVVRCADGLSAMFQNGTWNRTLPQIKIFDDSFVDQNVYSGLAVEVDHRQNLHELILGSSGIALNQALQNSVARVEQHNSALKQKAAAIPQVLRGSLTLDQFLQVPLNPNANAELDSAERELAATRELDPIKTTPPLPILELPEINANGLSDLLARGVEDLDAEAAARVNAHLATLPAGSERWISEGMRLQGKRGEENASECPFCAQGLGASPVLHHYRAFFSEAYRTLQSDLARMAEDLQRRHSTDARAAFQRSLETLVERRAFWLRFENLPAIEVPQDAIRIWQDSHAALGRLVNAKRANPLAQMEVDVEASAAFASHEGMLQRLVALNQTITEANEKILSIKGRAVAADPARLQRRIVDLKMAITRHDVTTDAICRNYIGEMRNKAATEGERDTARNALDQYRAGVFPRYQGRINHYLGLFGAGFQIGNVAGANRGGPSCTYNIVINGTTVPVAGGATQSGQIGFRNTLSAGDRNSLALAFFLATIDLDPAPESKVVIIDDPMTSLDEHRSLVTVQQIRRLASRVSQVIVLSHSKSFLCQIWSGSDSTNRTAAQVVRSGTVSTMVPWSVENDCVTEHDRRHALFQNYHRDGVGDEREVAVAIRPHLEAFIRVAFPEHFPPGSLLGPFREKCGRKLGTLNQILSVSDHQELGDLVEFGNLYHHDGNPAYQTQSINTQQLAGFVSRLLAFVRRPSGV